MGIWGMSNLVEYRRDTYSAFITRKAIRENLSEINAQGTEYGIVPYRHTVVSGWVLAHTDDETLPLFRLPK